MRRRTMNVDATFQRDVKVNLDAKLVKINPAVHIRNDSENNLSNQTGMEDERFHEKMIEKSIDKANKELEKFNRRVEYEVHEKTKTVMFRIKDINTGEIIKEIPPEKIQDMIAKMWELAGLFVDEQA